jgi:hypothetical protein
LLEPAAAARAAQHMPNEVIQKLQRQSAPPRGHRQMLAVQTTLVRTRPRAYRGDPARLSRASHHPRRDCLPRCGDGIRRDGATSAARVFLPSRRTGGVAGRLSAARVFVGIIHPSGLPKTSNSAVPFPYRRRS